MSTNEQKQAALLALRLIAAKAERLAHQLERSMLYPGQLDEGRDEIAAALADVRE